MDADVIRLEGPAVYVGQDFAGVGFVGDGEDVYFTGCRFTGCDLSGVTRATLVGNVFADCALPPVAVVWPQ